ncbi:MAG: MBL fold metallo-hydrolase [Firmicutes bacterium]|nr:MBL fold metallo-hydrolase [Bacillota bacterium]
MEITVMAVMAVGANGANCYIVGRDQQGIVIDPGSEGERILKLVDERGLQIKAIINTHGHFDHIGANDILRATTGAPLYIHEQDAPMLTDANKNLATWAGMGEVISPPADNLLHGGEVLDFGGLKLQILHTPGHTPGCICIQIGDTLFTGDTLFAGSVGRVDLPGSSQSALANSLHNVILALPSHMAIYPGHGPSSTLRHEREQNPFLQA